MKQFTVYPTLEEALYLHQQLVEEFGGSGGIRDLGLLESALARPRSGYYKTLFDQAAALMQSLTQNHPFLDGNKRVAFALTSIFLYLNGQHLGVTADEGESFLLERVIKKKIDVAEIASWLKKHSRKKKS